MWSVSRVSALATLSPLTMEPLWIWMRRQVQDLYWNFRDFIAQHCQCHSINLTVPECLVYHGVFETYRLNDPW